MHQPTLDNTNSLVNIRSVKCIVLYIFEKFKTNTEAKNKIIRMIYDQFCLPRLPKTRKHVSLTDKPSIHIECQAFLPHISMRNREREGVGENHVRKVIITLELV